MESAPHHAPCGVLVVDDHDGLRKTVADILRDLGGYAVDEAPDGAPVLAMLRQSPTRLVVLLDLKMPSVDGVAVLRTVVAQRRLATRHAFVLMTAHATWLPPEAQGLLSNLQVPVLAKPITIDTLLDAVQRAQLRLN